MTLSDREWAFLLRLVENPPPVPEWLRNAVKGGAALDDLSVDETTPEQRSALSAWFRESLADRFRSFEACEDRGDMLLRVLLAAVRHHDGRMVIHLDDLRELPPGSRLVVDTDALFGTITLRIA